MSTKVLCVGDIHAADKPPASVVDTYQDDILEMLEYVAKLEKEGDYDAVVWAGDVFNFKSPHKNSHKLVQDMLRVAQSYRNLYIVVGNHDLLHDRLETLPSQPLGVLFQAGVKQLNGWNAVSYDKSAGESMPLPIYGIPWQQDWLEKGTPDKVFKEWREGSKDWDLSQCLVVTHCPIYPPKEAEKQLFELVPTSGKHSLSEAMNNEGYLYYGHIHEDHGFFTDGGVTFGNVGAISRGSLHEYNVERKIQVAEWDSEKGFTAIEIPHKPASEVFYLEAKAESQAEEKEFTEFLSDIKAVTLAVNSTETVIHHLEGTKADKKVKRAAIDILREVSG